MCSSYLPPKLHILFHPPFIYIICHHFPHSTQSVPHLKLLRECARSSICGFSFEIHRSTDASVRLAVNSCVMCVFHLHATLSAPPFFCFLIKLTSTLNPFYPPKLHNLLHPPFNYIICHHVPHCTQSVTHLKLLRECARSSICGFSFEVHRSTDASGRLAVNSCVMCFLAPPPPLLPCPSPPSHSLSFSSIHTRFPLPAAIHCRALPHAPMGNPLAHRKTWPGPQLR